MTEQEFGALIRSKREAKGVPIGDLASRLKLSVSMLRSIEEGSLDRLPHAVYARGFIRAYAQAVNVAPEDIDAGIAVLFPVSMFEDVPTVPSPIDAAPARSKGWGGETLLAVLLLLCVLAIPVGGGWAIYSYFGEQIRAFIAKPLEAFSFSQTEALQAPEKPAAPPLSAAEPQRERAVPAEPAPVQPVAVDKPAAPVSPVAAVVTPAVRPASPMPPESPRVVAPAPVEGSQVTINAREECWVQVTVDGAGTRTFNVYPGETSLLPYKRKISLVLGNAGGVSVMHNSASIPLNAKQNERRALTFP